MDSWLLSSSSFHRISFSLILLVMVFVEIPLSQCHDDFYSTCRKMFSCGKFTNIDFPFWGDIRPSGCGYPGLKLNCERSVATIEIMKVNYSVLYVDPNSQILKISREDYRDGICSPVNYVSSTLDPTLFDFGPGYQNLTLFYGCAPDFLHFPFRTCGFLNQVVVHLELGAHGPPKNCNASVFVPIPSSVDSLELAILSLSKLEETIRDGFDVRWKGDTAGYCNYCKESMGVCGYDLNSNRSTCYHHPDDKGKRSTDSSLVVGLGVGGAGIVGLLLCFWIFFIMKRRKRLANESKSKDLSTPPSTIGVPAASVNFSQSTPSYPFLKSDLEKGSTYFGAHIFSYEELEEATDNFDSSRELGDGGFGKVYYGKLRDGRVVAVKRLYENNFKRVEQFKTEVAILTRLRHQNLVTLYGCTSKRSQELLLVYEYIPNGTVADHLHGNRSNSSLLTWPIRLSIAIESAGALAYLHASDVIHRDVKTNNILLDENFRVKVADFGLSRLFPTDVTHISTAPQGTPGYVDPEYYQCYQLTDKSDVFSFGVVLIELISSLPAVDTNRQRHNINLANMAISKIQDHALDELVDPFLGFEKDYTVRRMTTSVAGLAFRCLQQDRDMRPSMDEVLEDLRRIQNEEIGVQKAEVVDISADDVGLLKNFPPPLSPDLVVVTDKLTQVLRKTT